MNENHAENSKYIDGAIERIDLTIKHGKIKPKGRKVLARIKKEARGETPNFEREASCRHAGKSAHTLVADERKKISDDVRRDLGLDNK